MCFKVHFTFNAWNTWLSDGLGPYVLVAAFITNFSVGNVAYTWTEKHFFATIYIDLSSIDDYRYHAMVGLYIIVLASVNAISVKSKKQSI